MQQITELLQKFFSSQAHIQAEKLTNELRNGLLPSPAKPMPQAPEPNPQPPTVFYRPRVTPEPDISLLPKHTSPVDRLSQAMLQARYTYNPTDGCLYHKLDGPRTRKGTLASFIGDGTRKHRMVHLDSHNYLQSRLNWMYHFGYWPKKIVRHDGDNLNDKIGNLREYNQSDIQLAAYRRTREAAKKNAIQGGIFDMGLFEPKRWMIFAMIDGDYKAGARFDTFQQALAAYEQL